MWIEDVNKILEINIKLTLKLNICSKNLSKFQSKLIKDSKINFKNDNLYLKKN